MAVGERGDHGGIPKRVTLPRAAGFAPYEHPMELPQLRHL
jgi:hypothetical protein